MARTPSTMLPLGTEAPDFSLADANTGAVVARDDFRGKQGLLVAFICNHCPYVKHIKHELIAIAEQYAPKEIGVVGISSNDIDNYPDDAPDKMAAEGYPFPYLYDESQAVAKAYQAACTPDFFLFDAGFKLVYRGQMDRARPKNDEPIDGADLRAALDAVLAGAAPSPEQTPSLGCNIKWKAGNEPFYAPNS
jgi:peroxiredoxin